MKKRSFYNSSGYNPQSSRSNQGRFAAEVDDNLYISDSPFEDEDDECGIVNRLKMNDIQKWQECLIDFLKIE